MSSAWASRAVYPAFPEVLRGDPGGADDAGECRAAVRGRGPSAPSPVPACSLPEGDVPSRPFSLSARKSAKAAEAPAPRGAGPGAEDALASPARTPGEESRRRRDPVLPRPPPVRAVDSTGAAELARGDSRGRTGTQADREAPAGSARAHASGFDTVVQNAIVLWNALALEMALEGVDRPVGALEEDLRHILPTMLEHINFVGRFDLDRRPPFAAAA